jgi:hypothetical protein
MDARFFRSPHVLVSLLVALLIVAGGAASLAVVDRLATGLDASACDPIDLGGTPLDVRPTESTAGPADRTLDYVFAVPKGMAGGDARACSSVGDVTMLPSTDSFAHVEIHVHGPDAASVAATTAQVRFLDLGGRLGIAAWEDHEGRSGGPFGSGAASLDVTIRLPGTGAFDATARADVGDVDVEDLLLGNLTLVDHVGDVTVRGADLDGNATVATNVGKQTLSFASVENGTMSLSSRVDDVSLHLPQRADVGYDVHASSRVGTATVDIGPTETYDAASGHGTGGDVHARSAGYASKPTQVAVDASSDVGDVEVTAS